jgi:hypothetical protein
MARAVVKYAFAALLALLSTQAGVPSFNVVLSFEIVCTAEAEQQAPREVRRVRPARPAPQATSEYASRTRPEPETPVLFQRPPPTRSLFA